MFVGESACHIVNIIGPFDTGVMDVTVRGDRDVVGDGGRIVDNDCGGRFVMSVVGVSVGDGAGDGTLGTVVVADIVLVVVVNRVVVVMVGEDVVVTWTVVVVLVGFATVVDVVNENVVDVAVHSINPF